MPYWLVEGHFEHKRLKKGNSKVDGTLSFFKRSGIVCLLGMGDLA